MAVDPLDPFVRLLFRKRATVPVPWEPPAILLALDPGETTGWGLFTDGGLHDAGQLMRTTPLSIARLIELHEPTCVVCEEYRIYAFKTETHAWSTVPVAQTIGGVKLVCDLHQIPLIMQKAGDAKGFITNEKLRDWGYYKATRQHANDAIRHGCFALLFAKSL